jgi:hypothetical protein
MGDSDVMAGQLLRRVGFQCNRAHASEREHRAESAIAAHCGWIPRRILFEWRGV